MNETVRIGRIAGISIGLNWTILAIFLLITVSLAAGRFPLVYPDQSPAAYAAAGIVTAILFFASVLAHEMSHAIVAQRNGVEVEGIVLWFLGGVARLQGDADAPGPAFRIAAVGPLVSVLLGAGFLTASLILDRVDAAGLVVEAALWLGIINIVLAVFNMFPGAPLDGGRVLRAILWRISGDRQRSWVQAARAGRVIGFAIIGLGILQFAALGFGGLWFVILGWFLVMAARAEEEHAMLQMRLGDSRVRDVMSTNPVTAPADITAEQFLDQYVFRHRFSTFPVTDPAGRAVGLATMGDIKHLDADARRRLVLGDVATPIEELTTADADESLSDVIERLNQRGGGRILVTAGDRVAGIVSPVDIIRLLELRDLAGHVGRPPSSTRS